MEGLRGKNAAFVALVLGGLPLGVQALPPAPAPPAIVVPAPHAGPHAYDASRRLLTWTPGEVRCDSGAVARGFTLRRPLNDLVYAGARPVPTVLRFAVDAAGRVHSIRRDAPATTPHSGDIAPALAASRFLPGKALEGCSVSYVPARVPLGEAAFDDLVSYSMSPHSGRLPREGWARIERGSDCANSPRPQPLLRAYPDFGEVTATPGVRDWSLVRFDIDAEGRVSRPETAASTRNPQLDRAALAAVTRSRFKRGERSGCLYPYWRSPAVLPAPAKPASPERCAHSNGWEVSPALIYPEHYKRRAIEGWAVIRYDVAPWGATGNVTVLQAQPSADFGDQAKRMIETAKARKSEAGAQGCVVHVRYAMAGQDPQTPHDEPVY